MIPYGRQSIDDDDIEAVIEVMKSDWLTCGPKVIEFENALAAYCGAKHAVAVANGTAALHVAMLAGGLGPGNCVLTSANTFLASANCAEFVGATADFADIDPLSRNVSVDTLKAAWRDDVKAIVPVDFAGYPCDMPAIANLARSRGVIIIEDASHAVGSRLRHEGRWRRVGGHPWADLTTFSFHPVKTMTTGEGGAIITDDDRLAERCRLFRSHGMVRPVDAGARPSLPDPCPLLETGPWYYEMQEVGFNYRITDLQCALGLSQLRKLDKFVARRRAIVDAYNSAFASMKHLERPVCSSDAEPAWHLYAVEIDFEALGKSRARVMAELQSEGVGTQVHYIPVHCQPYYRKKYGYGLGKCPNAESYYLRCLSLPLYAAMSDSDIQTVIKAVRKVVSS